MNKKVVIGIIIGIIVLLLAGLLLFTFTKKEDNELKINTFTSDKIKIETLTTKDNKLVIKIKSTDKIDLVDFDIAFYNKEELVKTKDAFVKNLTEKEQYIAIDMPKDDEENIIDITKIDIKTIDNLYDTSNVEDMISTLKTETKKNEDALELTVKTTSTSKITEISLTTLFYKGSEIVSAQSSYVVELNKEKKLSVTLPYELDNGEIKYIDYDKVEVIVNHALKNK